MTWRSTTKNHKYNAGARSLAGSHTRALNAFSRDVYISVFGFNYIGWRLCLQMNYWYLSVMNVKWCASHSENFARSGTNKARRQHNLMLGAGDRAENENHGRELPKRLPNWTDGLLHWTMRQIHIYILFCLRTHIFMRKWLKSWIGSVWTHNTYNNNNEKKNVRRIDRILLGFLVNLV